jgi:hypothetical protein
MHRITTNDLGICHTLVMDRTNHDHRPNNSRKITPKNILKNILKTSEKYPLDGMLNAHFQFTHLQEDAKVTPM